MASSDIVLTAALRNNLLSLQSTQRLIDSVQLRLATGLKINSALDGPQQFFTSQSLNNRAGDLSRLLDGINLSIRTIEEADKGVTALTKLVQQAQTVAEEAKSEALAAQGFGTIRSSVDLRSMGVLVDGVNIVDGASDAFRLTVVQSNGTRTNIDVNLTTTGTVDDIVSQINANATNLAQQLVQASVSSSGKLEIKSLKEDAVLRITTTGATPITAAGYARLGLSTLVATEQAGAAGPTTRQSGTLIAGDTVRSGVSAAGLVNGAYEASATLVTAGYVLNYDAASTDNFNISLVVDGAATTIGGGTGYFNGTTIQEVVDDINQANVGIAATFNTNTGRIELKAGGSVSDFSLRFLHDDGSSAGSLTFGFGAGATGYVGGAVALAAGATVQVSERFIFAGGSASNLAQYENDFDTIRSQIDSLVRDANFRGVNLLNGGNLTTFFNETRSSFLVTNGVDFTAGGLGLNQANFTTTSLIQSSIDATMAALDGVRNFGQSIANSLSIIQTRRDFTEGTITTLKAGAGDLVNADQNEEGANLLALQTRQQLGVTALSLAAQSQQSVLRLF